MAFRPSRRKARRARDAAQARGRARNSESPMPFLVIPYPHIDPVLVHIGPFAIRWYALAYISAS